MARTKHTARKPTPDYWTSTQADKYREGVPETWRQAGAIDNNTASISPGCGSSVFEDVIRQLPTDARMLLADSLTAGDDVGSGRQANLAAARLSCKVLRRAVDDGLRSLRLNTLPDMPAQGPAPFLSNFPNVTSLTLSINSRWAASVADSCSHHLLPGEQPAPQFQLRSICYAYPPSLLLGPLQGQPLQSLHRLRSLTLIGQLTCFRSLCEQLTVVFAAGAAAPDPTGAGPSRGAGPGCGMVPGGTAVPESSGEGGTGVGGGDDECVNDDRSGATRSSNIMASEPAAPSVAAPACSGGAGAGGGSGGAAAWSLEHLNLGNVRFPRTLVSTRGTVKGHRALAVLGLQEMTLGVELLPGLEEHKVGLGGAALRGTPSARDVLPSPQRPS